MSTNAITMARHFEEAGMERPLADAVAERMANCLNEVAATKADFARLESSAATKADIADVKAEIKRLEGATATKVDLADVKGELKADIARLEVKMSVGLGLLTSMMAGLLVAFVVSMLL